MAYSSWLPVPIAILCVILGLLLLYFAVGSIVRYRKGMRHFPEVLPNYRCWCNLVDGILVVLTFGRCRPCYNFRRSHPHHHHHHLGRVGSGSVPSSILPTRPSRARNLAFEALQSDCEEEFGDITAAMHPSNAVSVSCAKEHSESTLA